MESTLQLLSKWIKLYANLRAHMACTHDGWINLRLYMMDGWMDGSFPSLSVRGMGALGRSKCKQSVSRCELKAHCIKSASSSRSNSG
ncbi:unnamed protein product [Onchocerca flexuosa]|uniref:Transposase n=1 Tax=Onchocerca flexuosa TaxID=387005 RepID=A0A183I0A4_9BILA|nr:unnamed protein product [Onchocerca flexuosa]